MGEGRSPKYACYLQGSLQSLCKARLDCYPLAQLRLGPCAYRLVLGQRGDQHLPEGKRRHIELMTPGQIHLDLRRLFLARGEPKMRSQPYPLTTGGSALEPQLTAERRV